MHEMRNFVLVLLLIAAAIWALVAWLWLGPDAPLLTAQRWLSIALGLVCGGWLVYALTFEDILPDHLRESVGDVYYEVDGLSFLPLVRVHNGQAELSIYYQNRFENPAEAIIHLRLPEGAFHVGDELRVVNVAFRAGGGDFGVIHQPIVVPRETRGDVVTVTMAAASYYPRSHGTCWRRKPGIPCGTLPVDWSGSAFKSGVSEASAEVELHQPVELHLAMPTEVDEESASSTLWRQERLVAGEELTRNRMVATS